MKNFCLSIRICNGCIIILISTLFCNIYSFNNTPDLILTLRDIYQNEKSYNSIKEEYLLSSRYPKLIHGVMPVRLPVGMSREVAVELLSSDSRIASVETDYIVHTTGLPNDPYFNLQWSLYNPGKNRADIKALEAWRLHKGSKKIVIAILDTGIDYTHPDLARNIWRNPGEVPGNDNDDDDNGFVDDEYGWDFAYDDSGPLFSKFDV